LKGIALKKWESTLNLRVHAHGYYVELIMRASCKGNYPLGINSAAPMILHSTFEYYLLVPGGYHTFALHLMNFDETIHLPVITIPWVLGCRQPRTLNAFFHIIPFA